MCNVFTPVCHSVPQGVGFCQTPLLLWTLGRHPQVDTPLDRHPLGRHPPADTPPADTHPLGRHPPLPCRHPPGRWLPQRTVRILLECILVQLIFFYLCRYYYQSFFALGRRIDEPDIPSRDPLTPRVSCDEYDNGSCRWYDEWNYEHIIQYADSRHSLH